MLPKRYGHPDPENLDPTPAALPGGAHRPPPLQDIIANFVRQEIEARQGEQFESFEESDDFSEEHPDTLDMTPYELTALHAESESAGFDPFEKPVEATDEAIAEDLNPTPPVEQESPAEAPEKP